MKEDKNRNPLAESIILAIVATVLIFSLMGISNIFLFLVPIPFIVLGIRNSLGHSILSLSLTILVVAMGTSVNFGISLLITLLPITIALVYSIKKRESTEDTLVLATAIFLISILLVLMLENNSFLGYISEIENSFNLTLEGLMAYFEEVGSSSYDSIMTEDMLESIHNYLMMTIPAMTIIVSIVTVYLNYSISLILAENIGYKIYRPSFSRFRLSKMSTLGILIIFVLTYILMYFQVPYSGALRVNLVVLVGFLMNIQGIALVDSLLIKYRMRKFFRVLFILFNILVLKMGAAFVFMGFLDMVFDFRKLDKNKTL